MKKPQIQFIDHHFNDHLRQLPVYCKHKSEDPNMKGLHAHSGFEFHFAYSSQGMILIGDRISHVLPGKVYIIRPQVYHFVQQIKKSVYHRSILSVDENYLWELVAQDEDILTIFRSWFPSDEIDYVEFNLERRDMFVVQSLLEQVEQELLQQGQRWAIYVKTSILQVLMLLNRAREARVSQTSLEMKEISDRMTDYIREHCCEPIDMTMLAERFHISKSYMFKIFKMFTGYTPYQFLMQHRIKRAKQLLSNSSSSITQIASKTGFNDSSHFIRTFKEATGMTPGEYKRFPVRITS